MWLAALLGIVALFGAAGVAVLRQPAVLSGVVVDARSGRVASGASLTYDGRVLRRFRQKDFAFERSASGAGLVIVEAPGYKPADVVIAAGQDTIEIRLEPLAIPGLTGVAMFPKVEGETIRLPARLLGPDGAVLPEFPAVEIKARVVTATAAGAPVGYLDLTPQIDGGGPEMGLAIEVGVAALAGISRPNAATYALAIKAGETVVSSRPFPLPPEVVAARDGP